MTEKSSSLHLIGKIHSSQGVRGDVFVILNIENPPWLSQWKTLILKNLEGAEQSFKILNKKPHSKQGKTGFILQLEGVSDRDVADSLVHQTVWVTEDYLTSKKGETIYLKEILNFLVVDATRGEVGPIVGFSSNGAQDLLCIDVKGQVYEVPFVKAFLQKIDFENKKVLMDIPQGLLEDFE